MSSPKPGHYQYIIVGQGIAGTNLAAHLLCAGKQVLVIAADNSNVASAVAAGIINPVTGKRMVRSWLVDDLLPYALAHYRQLEKEIGMDFLDEVTVCRYLKNPEDKRYLDEQTGQDWFDKYLTPLTEYHPGIQNAIAAVEIKPCLRIHTGVLLKAYREYLSNKGLLLDEQFDHSQLQLTESGVRYKGFTADKVLFAEGAAVQQNPWFSWVPLNPSKGEILIARIPGFAPDRKRIAMKGIYFVSLYDDVFYIGSANEWKYDHVEPTAHKREELLKKMQDSINVPFEIVGHRAAIKPAVKDRRPLVGLHPVHKQLGLFNGMGTKGYSLSPYFAEQWVRSLDGGDPIDEAVQLERYYHLAEKE